MDSCKVISTAYGRPSPLSEKIYEFRDTVFLAVQEIARADRNVVVLTNDMGAMGLDNIREELPGQVVNVGISEQNMMSMAGGLAFAGKTVFVYGIVAHITARCFEQIKLDICFPNLPVTLLGVGAGLSYGVDGPTHHGVEDIAILRSLGSMQIFNPADGPTAGAAVHAAYNSRRPAYVRMDKEMLPALHAPEAVNYADGLAVTAQGNDVAIVSTGVLSWAARGAAKLLAEKGIKARVIDVFRLKPLNEEQLAALLRDVPIVLTVEENVANGGLGSLVAEVIAEQGQAKRFRRLSLGHEFLLGSASREWASKKFCLNAAGIADAVQALATSGSVR